MAGEFAGKTMKAARLLAHNQPYQLETVPIPSIGPNDLLLRVGAAGFCHTDYLVYDGSTGSPCPLTPSHEPAGTIVAVGSQAAAQWKVGQRVGMLNFRHRCRDCLGCRTWQDARFCERKDVMELAGITADGAFAEYVVADAEGTVELPTDLPFEQAAPLMCAGATVYAGLRSATKDVPAGSAIGIIGVGGLGQLGIQFARALGFQVAAVDNRVAARALAAELPLPAHKIVDPSSSSAATESGANGPIEDLVAWAGEGGLAAVVVCTDDVPANKWALKVVRPRGTVVLIGFPVSGFQFDPMDIVFRELVLKGSLLSSVQEARDMVALVAKHGIRSHISTFGLDEVPSVLEKYREKDLKGRLVMKIES